MERKSRRKAVNYVRLAFEVLQGVKKVVIRIGPFGKLHLDCIQIAECIVDIELPYILLRRLRIILHSAQWAVGACVGGLC